MKYRVEALLVLILFAGKFTAAQDDRKPVDWVDVFIGTSNSRWMLGPYATAPFGMIQLGPDNQGYVWMSGYDYAINSISGFSHISFRQVYAKSNPIFTPDSKCIAFVRAGIPPE